MRDGSDISSESEKQDEIQHSRRSLSDDELYDQCQKDKKNKKKTQCDGDANGEADTHSVGKTAQEFVTVTRVSQ